MYEVDFMAVENSSEPTTRSGDAIAARFKTAWQLSPAVIVVDGGFTDTGQEVVDNVADYYGTSTIDLVISTHMDSDHLNGLQAVLEQCTVGELLVHQPWLYRADAYELGNYQRLRQLVDYARAQGVTVTQPFTGLTRFDGALQILGPTEQRYRELLDEALTAAPPPVAAAAHDLVGGLKRFAKRLFAGFPEETLEDDDDASARNQMSVITLLTIDGARMMLTGDAGIASLQAAADRYEQIVGPLSSNPLSLLQAPHHGSKHNLGPTVLDRLLGTEDVPHSVATCAYVSSAAASTKHPSGKVLNALGRRGASVFVTDGKAQCFTSGIIRPGWSAATPVDPVDEDD